MYTEMTFTNFRCFEKLHVSNLARVNLFVGANNSGKTSLLEGAHLLFTAAAPRSILQALGRRGEYALYEAGGLRPMPSVKHLFHGHTLRRGASFRLQSLDEGEERKIVCTLNDLDDLDASAELDRPQGVRFVRKRSRRDLSMVLETDEDGIARSPLCLHVVRTQSPDGAYVLPLSSEGGMDRDYYRFSSADEESSADEPQRISFLAISSMEAPSMAERWKSVALKPEEERILESLRLIEPKVERIAFLPQRRSDYPIIVKLQGIEEPVPLGSLGEGTKRLLALTLSLVPSERGAAMIDEIDTGLHYSVLPKMWRLVIETARRLDLQVFATTHSLDCIRGLGSVIDQQPELAGEVAAHRLESGQGETVPFSGDEIVVAAQNELEVR